MGARRQWIVLPGRVVVCLNARNQGFSSCSLLLSPDADVIFARVPCSSTIYTETLHADV